MGTSDDKDVLLALAELLREHMTYTAAVGNSATALIRAILDAEPSLRLRYEMHWTELIAPTLGGAKPPIDDTIRRLDDIIRRLKAQ